MEIAPDTGAPSIRLADPTATAVRRAHDRAAQVLGVSAATAPPADLDAGIAGPGLRVVLEALVDTTGELARLNRLLGAGVGDVRSALGVTDDDVATRLRAAAGTRP